MLKNTIQIFLKIQNIKLNGIFIYPEKKLRNKHNRNMKYNLIYTNGLTKLEMSKSNYTLSTYLKSII